MPDLETKRAIALCSREAIHEAREEIVRLGYRWEDFSSAMLPLKALYDRVATWGKGKAARVPFDRLAKKMMAREFPEFPFRKEFWPVETLQFVKPLAPASNLIWNLNKIHSHGVGKLFSLQFQLEFCNAPFRMIAVEGNIFGLYPFGPDLEWAYGTAEDLEGALADVALVIRQTTPILDRVFKKWLSEVPKNVPEGLPQRVGLTAREALIVATATAKTWRPDAQLVALSGSGVDDSGRLTIGGSWRFDFDSSADSSIRCRVDVPGHGRVESNFSDVVTLAVPLIEWADSGEAWPEARRMAAQHGGFGPPSQGYIGESYPNPEHKWTWSGHSHGLGNWDIQLSAKDLQVIEGRPPG